MWTSMIPMNTPHTKICNGCLWAEEGLVRVAMDADYVLEYLGRA